MRGEEELKHLQAFTEVCTDGELKGTTRWRSHQATHACKLSDLRGTTTSTRVGHHADGVIFVKVGQDHVTKGCGGGIPHFDHFFVSFVIGHQTHAIEVVELFHLGIGFFEHLFFFGWDFDIADRYRNRTTGRIAEA